MTTNVKRTLDRPEHGLETLRHSGAPVAYAVNPAAPENPRAQREAAARVARHAAFVPELPRNGHPLFGRNNATGFSVSTTDTEEQQ
jgi:hypothetical protein